ncbi:hypothetical protein [Leisingera sp. ANG-Vp]|uniref:hypothetical protein n=1 Tax=Leisingera sp. ANG-Vp TaxID=1577896 RepID=UPI0005806099|nr:hypothetical protein [Leisingera sp. ANG-Vp]KIC20350.1 hypothetical protein RA20_09045 [Leisingera sp. ANG-Vp]
MRKPFDDAGAENETPAANELEFSNRVAGNLENKSGLLAAILGEDEEEPCQDSHAERKAGHPSNGSKVVAFPAKPKG